MLGTTSRGIAAASVLVLAAATLVVGPASPAHAAVPVTKAGWWTRSPAPPAVPEGGIAAGVAPDGNLSVGAFQLDTAGGASGATLTLTESDGQGQQAASLQACPTADEWAPVGGGALTIAPRPTCSDPPALLNRSTDGVWSIDLNPLLKNQTGAVSIMIVPGPSPAGLPGGASAFQISFAKPTVSGSVKPAPVEDNAADTTFAPDTAFSPSYDALPVPEFSPAFGGPLATPEVATGTGVDGQPSVTAPSENPSVNFPIRATGNEAQSKSRLVIVVWFILALVFGAAAAAWHWARDEGLLSRLVPLRTRGNLLPPPN